MLTRSPKFDWFWLPYLMLVLWLWFPLWLSGQVPAFRDGFHFYLPQLVWLNGCYQQGEYFPLWNPNEGLGSSVAGQPSWQLFYPLRLVWLIPALSLPQKMALYFGIHQVLAAMGILRATQVMQLSYWSRWLAAVSFSLSCPFVFQHTNLIYLCSAAWTGWALAALLSLLRLSQAASGLNGSIYIAQPLICFTSACCLMVLSGDPHSAINAALIAAVGSSIVLFSRQPRQVIASDKSGFYLKNNFRKSRVALLALVALGIGMLTWSQMTETWSWYRVSSRAAAPPMITDSSNTQVAKILDAIAPSPTPIFDYSLSPWSLPSLIWPTIGGHYQPENSRWVSALASEGRMWVPSIYMGLFPVLLCIFSISLTGRLYRFDDRWLIGAIAFTLLCALGNYSVGWLIREAVTALGFVQWQESMPADSSLSLYGVLAELVPGYDRLRYPAKWTVWTIALISLFSASRLDALTRTLLTARLLSNAIIIFISMGAFGMIVPYFAAWLLPEVADSTRLLLEQTQDRLLGPLNLQSAHHAVIISLVWPIAILGIILAGCQLPVAFRPAMLVMVTAAELAFCNQRYWTVTTRMPNLSVENSIGRADLCRWANTRQAQFQYFSDALEEDTLLAQLLLSKTFSLGKLNHLDDQAALHASASLQPYPVAKLIRWLQENDNLAEQQSDIDPVLSHLGVTHRLARDPADDWDWRQVTSTKPICEFIPDAGQYNAAASDSPGFLHWCWLSNQAMHISVQTPVAGKLIVRQFNDGGWALEQIPIVRNENPNIPLELVQKELFLVIPIQPGEYDWKFFRRKPLWFLW